MVVRLAVIDQRLCSPSKCQLECIRSCPVNRLGKDCLTLTPATEVKAEKKKLKYAGKFEYTKQQREDSLALIDEQLCTGCGICPKVCPFNAISIIKLVEAEPEELVYSYGENAFELYRLALPRKGITGIVGENGCGKSTNLKLLVGKLKPQEFPSKEIKGYFESFEDGGVIIKPQELAVVKGEKTVGELLKGIDEAGRLSGLEKVFGLQALYGKKLEQLSGGELQKAVVSAALLRDKETFVLDEPFAFLDYAYRLRLISYLKENFSEKQVLIVDHDISLLSYLCNESYIFYGKPAAYGIVSQVYATDRAINMFLEGFIKPENVKFREPIAYKHYMAEEKKYRLATLEKMGVQRGSFSMVNDVQLDILEGEIVGVAGINGIGKSTFCEKLSENHKESAIKKQILDRTGGRVGDTYTHGDIFTQTYVNHMGMKRLEFYNVRDLSGGEHQKVEILKALSQDKKFYILDEPTNMLDVPARIALSKVLRDRVQDGKAVIIVDHDFEFLYNTVDRVIVMEGESGKSGRVKGIYDKEEGLRMLMDEFDLTYRRDPETKRLKLNKAGSKKEQELKRSGKYIE